MIILFAETTSGKRINALDWREELEDPEKNEYREKFRCPACKEPVFFKNGARKLPHFSHYRKAFCESFSEGETEAHLAGKIQLWEWAQAQGLEVELEPWLPSLQQRPDLLLRSQDGRKIVLEYQCSPIPLQQMNQRTKGYQSQGYEVFWICGKGYIPSQRLLDKHTVFLIADEEGGLGLNCLDSTSGELVLCRSISFTNQGGLSLHSHPISLSCISFSDFEKIRTGGTPPGLHRIESAAENLKKGMPLEERFLLLHKRDPAHRCFLEQMYLRRHHIQMLPDLLFRLPVKEVLYQTPAYIWKYYFLCWLEQKGIGETVSRQEVFQFYLLLQDHRFLTLRPAPFVAKETYTFPFFAFIQTLTEEKALEPIGVGLWLFSKSFLSTDNNLEMIK